jgi:UPF0271 protein
MSIQIDLNADVGELPGIDGRRLDAAILEVVSSCNIACGGHAGDDATMKETTASAMANGVRIGAHPSFADRENFGRKTMQIAPEALAQSLTEQICALLNVVRDAGGVVAHVKPHGALYNMAAKDTKLSEIVVGVTASTGINLVVGPPESALQTAAKKAGLGFLAEGFADRAYEPTGALVGRGVADALINDLSEQGRRAVQMATLKTVQVRTGEVMSLPVQTICLHGDSPHAAAAAREIAAALHRAGVDISAPNSN